MRMQGQGWIGAEGKMIAQGELFEFYIDGKLFGSTRRDSLKGDWVGIGLWASPGSAEIDIDNVKFWDLKHLLP